MDYSIRLLAQLFLAVFVIGHTPVPKSPIFLHSPRVTEHGVWGEFQQCPLGKVVIGMQLKVEPKSRTADETGLNGVKFFCSPPRTQKDDHPDRRLPDYPAIRSLVGDFGQWQSYFECDGVATGFQLRSEPPRGPLRDDTAANNLRLFCSELNGDYLEGDGTEWGNWTEPQKCEQGKAICGLQTQVEPDRGIDIDDTSLNNVAVKCCNTTTQPRT